MNGWSHMGEIVLCLANGQTGRGCRRLSAVLGGDREAQLLAVGHRSTREHQRAGQASGIAISISDLRILMFDV